MRCFMMKLVSWVGSTFSWSLLRQMHVGWSSNWWTDLKATGAGSPPPFASARAVAVCRSGSSFVSALWVGMGIRSASARTRCAPSQMRTRRSQWSCEHKRRRQQ